MKYNLYHNKENVELKITKVSKGKRGLASIYPSDLEVFNNCYYICSDRKKLKDKAQEIKREWIEDTEDRLLKMIDLKI